MNRKRSYRCAQDTPIGVTVMSDVITLITETFSTDVYGNQKATESTNDVFCEVRSISQSEYFAGGETGHRPVFRFDVFFGDYGNERLVEYNSKRYYIYRVYRDNDTCELYAEERGGVYEHSGDVPAT